MHMTMNIQKQSNLTEYYIPLLTSFLLILIQIFFSETLMFDTIQLTILIYITCTTFRHLNFELLCDIVPRGSNFSPYTVKGIYFNPYVF